MAIIPAAPTAARPTPPYSRRSQPFWASGGGKNEAFGTHSSSYHHHSTRKERNDGDAKSSLRALRTFFHFLQRVSVARPCRAWNDANPSSVELEL